MINLLWIISFYRLLESVFDYFICFVYFLRWYQTYYKLPVLLLFIMFSPFFELHIKYFCIVFHPLFQWLCKFLDSPLLPVNVPYAIHLFSLRSFVHTETLKRVQHGEVNENLDCRRFFALWLPKSIHSSFSTLYY